jgi:hypothetical protein
MPLLKSPDDAPCPLSPPADPLVIAGKAYSSRLLTGTGKFKDLDETRRATDAAGAQIVTVRIRRTNIGQNPASPTCSTCCRRTATPSCPTPPAATPPTTPCAPAAWRANCSTATSW